MTISPAFKAVFTLRKLLMVISPWLILGGYWLFMFILTHLPATHIPDVHVMGKDRTLHYLAYLVLGLIFWLCYYRNVRPSFRQKRTWLMIFTLVAYGVFDELTQKYVGRTTDIMDLLFDTLGIITAIFMLFFIRRLIHWLFVIWPVLFVFSHWPCQTHFVELPDELKFIYPLSYMAGYCSLTIILWRCLSPKNKFMVNIYIFAWTTSIMLAYSFFDQFVLLIMRKGFDSEKLTTAMLAILIGIIVSFLLGLENQAEDNYRKYLSHLEDSDFDDV